MIMKNVFSYLLITALALFAFTSCDEEKVEPNNDEGLNLNTAQGYLGLRTSSSQNDEPTDSTENEIDCFAINYPVEVIMPGQSPQTVNNDEELENLIDPWFEDDANFDSEEFPTFTFPITVTLENGSDLIIYNDEQLCDLFYYCYDDWEDDWDDDDDEEECDDDDDDDEEDDD